MAADETVQKGRLRSPSAWELEQGEALDKAFEELDELNNSGAADGAALRERATSGVSDHEVNVLDSQAEELLTAMEEKVEKLERDLAEKQKEYEKVKKLADLERQKAEQERQNSDEQKRRYTTAMQDKEDLERKIRQEKLEMERLRREKDDAERKFEEQVRETQKRIREVQQEKFECQSRMEDLNRKFDMLKVERDELQRKQDEHQRNLMEQQDKARRADEEYKRAQRDIDELNKRNVTESGRFAAEVQAKEIMLKQLLAEKDIHQGALVQIRRNVDDNNRIIEQFRERERILLREKDDRERDLRKLLAAEQQARLILEEREKIRNMPRGTCYVDEIGDRHCNVSKCLIQ